MDDIFESSSESVVPDSESSVVSSNDGPIQTSDLSPMNPADLVPIHSPSPSLTLQDLEITPKQRINLLGLAKHSAQSHADDTFSLSLTSNEESQNFKSSGILKSQSSGVLKTGTKGLAKSVQFQSPLSSDLGSAGPDTKRLQSAVSEVSTGISSGSEQHAKSLYEIPTLKNSASETLRTMSVMTNVIKEKPEEENQGSINTMSLLNSKPLKDPLQEDSLNSMSMLNSGGLRVPLKDSSLNTMSLLQSQPAQNPLQEDSLNAMSLLNSQAFKESSNSSESQLNIESLNDTANKVYQKTMKEWINDSSDYKERLKSFQRRHLDRQLPDSMKVTNMPSRMFRERLEDRNKAKVEDLVHTTSSIYARINQVSNPYVALYQKQVV